MIYIIYKNICFQYNNIIEKIAVALFASAMVALLGYAFVQLFLVR